MKAAELIQKLVTRRFTGKETVEVMFRFQKGQHTIDQIRDFIQPQYGEMIMLEAIDRDDTDDPLSKLLHDGEVAVRCTFDLDSAIAHLMALPPQTRIRT